MKLTSPPLALCALLAASCSASATPATTPSVPPPQATNPSSEAAQPAATHRPVTRVALVTAELRNQLVVVSVPGGRVFRRIAVAADPKTVASAPGGPAAVVSPGSGAVTVFGSGLQRLALFRHFESPQLAAFTPEGAYLLVTDAAGTLTSIELAHMRVAGTVAVGAGAHHLAVSPDGRRVWLALGETAGTIVIVDVADPTHMRVVRRLHPPVAAHDVAFAPDGRTVWISSSTQAYVSVYGAGGRLIDTVAAGRGPQHVLFAHGRAYISSGYASSIEMVDPMSRAVLRRTRLPYGSFNLACAGPWLVVTSVLNGELTVMRAATLRPVHHTRVASVARSVAVLTR
jgi:hypothetical protein